MKNFNKLLLSLCGGALALSACSDFEDINTNPTLAQGDQVRSYYALNKSILDAQLGPHEAERIFVYNWKSGARYHQMNHLVTGTYADDYMQDYLDSRISQYMKHAALAIDLAEQEVENGELTESERAFSANVKQVARIWLVYVTSEYVDNWFLK